LYVRSAATSAFSTAAVAPSSVGPTNSPSAFSMSACCKLAASESARST
jgi:hypothetical protein